MSATIIPEIDLEREFGGRVTAFRALAEGARGALEVLMKMEAAGIGEATRRAVALAVIDKLAVEFSEHLPERRARDFLCDALLDRPGL
ncbi:MAG TPA: hypothetical protein VFL91_21245 [Thermomicrobiales bacterium]|nr:hypothetical protein [Thermomicrobiales bacterium]